MKFGSRVGGAIGFGTCLLGMAAAAFVPEWEPLFQGIDHAVLKESAPRISVLRIDLDHPGISFQGTPSTGSPIYETDRQKTTNFLETQGVQVAINANFFYDYTATEAKIHGLVVTEGQVVSPGEGTGGTWTAWEEIHITSNNVATYNHYPDHPLSSNVWTAVAGETIIYNGNVWGYSDTSQHPRTALGLSQDGCYLYMITADGRQYYDGIWCAGAYRWEMGEWLQDCGAYRAIMLDGGGSSTMAMESGSGGAVLLNVPSDAAGERPVSNCLGVYALPLDPVIISLKPLAGNVVEMVFNCSAPSTFYPLMSTNLVDGSWGMVGHATNSAGPFATITNLSFSAALGADRVIYLQTTNSPAFFGIGR